MGFLDLNIPYQESKLNISPGSKASLESSRLKLATKSIELGYTSIAYNHTVKGVISESQRCRIPLFPLSSILRLSPSLSASINFHRQLLSLPPSPPFRQYTRVTLILDTPRHLHSSTPILQSYDIVAVSPRNQTAFEHACQAPQVDIISIDFSEKLPFWLKQPMVKAAVERGIYFEITYACLIVDAQARSQMISNAKLLVNWTQGKNIIISSGAPSVTELRGPYDVANLSSMLGLTMERSKAAISKNCRSVIENSLRKKHCYKEVIKVEKHRPGEELIFDDWLQWDSISNAEGDLSLDDMGKSFSASCNVLKDAKPIDFVSALNDPPSHGLQIKDTISKKVAVADHFGVSKDLTTPGDQGLVEAVCEMSEQALSFCSLHKKDPALAKVLMEPSISDLVLPVSLPCDSIMERQRRSGARDTSSLQIEAKRVSNNDKELPPVLFEESFHDNHKEDKRSPEERDTSIVQFDGLAFEKSYDHTVTDIEKLIQEEVYSTPSDVCLYEITTDREDITGTSDLSAAILDEPHKTDYRKTENDNSVALGETVDQETIRTQMLTDGPAGINNKLRVNSPTGSGGVKRKIYRRISLFRFKHNLSPRPLRKKARR